MNSSCLKKTDNVKYISVIILDHRLSWTQHIAHVKKKMSNAIVMIYRARSYLT